MSDLSQFDKKLALECARLTKMAYTFTYPIEYTCVQVLPNQFGFVLQKDNRIFIVIRGTMDLQDFIADAECLYEKTSFGNIHRGFFNDFSYIMPEILIALEKIQLPYVDIIITGHSLGAAVASLVSYALYVHILVKMYSFQAKLACYPIAMPHVGDASFAERYATVAIPTFSIANINDIVPKVPIGFGYVPLVNHVQLDFNYDEIVKNHAIEHYLLHIEDLS